MLTLALKNKRYKKRSIHPVKTISHCQKMDKLEKQETAKSTPVVKNKLNEWCKPLADFVPKLIKSAVNKTFTKVKNSILSLYNGAE